MLRLLNWLDAAPHHSANLCRAGSKYFCRLMLVERWKLSAKEFPTSFINGKMKADVFSCMGYSDDSYEAAIEEAFSYLPD